MWAAFGRYLVVGRKQLWTLTDTSGNSTGCECFSGFPPSCRDWGSIFILLTWGDWLHSTWVKTTGNESSAGLKNFQRLEIEMLEISKATSYRINLPKVLNIMDWRGFTHYLMLPARSISQNFSLWYSLLFFQVPESIRYVVSYALRFLQCYRVSVQPCRFTLFSLRNPRLLSTTSDHFGRPLIDPIQMADSNSKNNLFLHVNGIKIPQIAGFVKDKVIESFHSWRENQSSTCEVILKGFEILQGPSHGWSDTALGAILGYCK